MTDVHEDRRSYALVVDDDGLLRMDACEILEQAGFRTLEADNGDAAILMLEQHLCIDQLWTVRRARCGCLPGRAGCGKTACSDP